MAGNKLYMTKEYREVQAAGVAALKAEIMRLRDALKDITKLTGYADLVDAFKIARRALAYQQQARCAECDCKNPPSECNWIKPRDQQNARATYSDREGNIRRQGDGGVDDPSR